MFHTLNRFEGVQGGHPVDIKCEAIEDTPLNRRLPSNSTCTFSNTQHCTVSSSPVALRRYSSPGAPSRRTHFQSSSLRQAHSKRDSRKVSDRSVTMSHPFSSRGTPSRMLYSQSDSPGRRSADNGQRVMQSPPYTLPSAFVQSHGSMDIGPQASGSSLAPTSSLSGAVGDMNIPPHLWNTTTRPYSNAPTSWVPGAHNMSNIPPNMQSHTHSTVPYNTTPTTDLNTASHPNHPSATPRSPPFAHTYPSQMTFQQDRSPQNSPAVMLGRPGSRMSFDQARRPSQDATEEENKYLRKKVKDLELANEKGRQRIRELEAELAGRSISDPSTRHPGPSMSTATTAGSSTMPAPLAMQASWKARTDARIRLFCSLNRAGNALCSWHDSRRERRIYPPRMAPTGYLNCGCTHEEALFEESLSRHGVGSYHPGEAVRMDPALRNPLLKVLQERYGYRDGDFERDPTTGDWKEGEGSTSWEQKLLSGASNSKKRGDDRR
ncbi:uncharacterized protein BJ212DRAFT_1396172 [Suillus subaureus]|uniref:Uncharacterized protein n=1 Tax=Suillus subaureus TaxID=48587 RepID=A0A9P7DUI1_9AGAM|nr:uncharacterized protein BJ212DRAFT_1396172 [Suillus subaureus]KAG1803334.1 hypothetical protein BJ212DRAFT_1396172 [Suillus subaureus]